MTAEETLTAEEIKAVQIREQWIGKWGWDTVRLCNDNTKPERVSDLLCMTTLTVCSTYSKAIMTLLTNGLRMPTQALLRVLFEVGAKVAWCLDNQEAGEAIEDRIHGWEKTALNERNKLLLNFINITSGELRENLQHIVRLQKERCNQLKCEAMPKTFTELLKELGGDSDSPGRWLTELHPHLYGQFNNAIHLDFASLCGKASIHDKKVTCDSDEPIEKLAQYCVVNMHMIFLVIRRHYCCDTNKMTQEFKVLAHAESRRV